MMLDDLNAATLDEIDLQILRVIQENGRISNVDLAASIELSPPATHARLKRLQADGIIQRFVALLDEEQLGFDMLCFVNISLRMHGADDLRRFRTLIAEMPEVLECYHVTGEFDYLLKVVVRSRRDLLRFVQQNLTPIPGIARIHTSLVLDEIKRSTALPLGA